MPIRKDPKKSSNRAVVSTSLFRTHVVSGERYRYLSYQDGSEELYDIKNDPHQWYNLASDPALAEEKAALAHWLPKINAPNLGSPPGTRRSGSGRPGPNGGH